MSLAENTVRLAMHPADQFEAFAALIDQGNGCRGGPAIRRRGKPRPQTHEARPRRAALLKEYRNDGITLECLMAFTLTDDHKQQLKVFKSLQDWQKDRSRRDPGLPHRADDRGRQQARPLRRAGCLQAAGGTSRADLFGNEVYLENSDLLHRLAEEKLDAIRKQMEAEGWGWIEINPERDWNTINRCGRIQPRLIDAPDELLARRRSLMPSMEEMEQALEDTELDALLDQQEACKSQLTGRSRRS